MAPVGPRVVPARNFGLGGILLLGALAFVLVASFMFVGGGLWFISHLRDRQGTAPGAGVGAPTEAQPQVLFNEARELTEGAYMTYSFTLNRDARLQVEVSAAPEDVSVMLMTSLDLYKFQQAQGALFGGNYTFRKALSNESVKRMNETEVVPSGEWSIVVLRPNESALFGKPTTADVKLTVY